MADTGVILAAAGQGRRMGKSINKVYLKVGGHPVISYSLDLFESLEDVAEIVVVVHPQEVDYFKECILAGRNFTKSIKVVPGGEERQDSIREGLAALDDSLDLVAIHDAARPLLSRELALNLIREAREFRAACPGVVPKDTIREAGDHEFYGSTLDRSNIYCIQTPQVFSLKMLRLAYQKASEEGMLATDDAQLYQRYCGPIRVVPGDYRNIKITTAEDLDIVYALLGRKRHMRTGTGFDVHRLVEGRDLIIGGVKIPFEKGLLGHSDADVLVHALCDALLGAAGLGDIGRYFPDTDDRFKGINSLILLKNVATLLTDRGLEVVNVDGTIIAQAPKMAPYIPQMQKLISEALGVAPDAVNIKATTTEGLGFTGRGEGIAAQATVLVQAWS